MDVGGWKNNFLWLMIWMLELFNMHNIYEKVKYYFLIASTFGMHLLTC